jgi:hypothetical protein
MSAAREYVVLMKRGAEYPFFRELRSPLDDHMLRPLDPRCEVVQFSEPLTDDEYRRLALFLNDYPSVPLRAYMSFAFRDLEFLRHFGRVRQVQIDAWMVENLDGLNYLTGELEFLALGATKRTLSLSVLNRFRGLKQLAIEGHRKNIEVVAKLEQLEQLTLRSVSVHDLTFLTPLRRLWWIAIRLGGIRDLGALPEIGALKYVELWMIRALEDLSPLSEIGTLQYLFLQDLSRVAALPRMEKLQRLRRVHLQKLKMLRDLRPLASAKALEDLLVAQAPQLGVEDFRPLFGHPSLKRAWIALGDSAPFGARTKTSAQVEQSLGLAPIMDFKPRSTEYDWR